jgi:hypothetical protein
MVPWMRSLSPAVKPASHTAQLMKKRFGSEWKQHLIGVAVVSIGPQTSRSCRENFGRVDAEADPHDLEGLVEGLHSSDTEQLLSFAVLGQLNTTLLSIDF